MRLSERCVGRRASQQRQRRHPSDGAGSVGHINGPFRRRRLGLGEPRLHRRRPGVGDRLVVLALAFSWAMPASRSAFVVVLRAASAACSASAFALSATAIRVAFSAAMTSASLASESSPARLHPRCSRPPPGRPPSLLHHTRAAQRTSAPLSRGIHDTGLLFRWRSSRSALGAVTRDRPINKPRGKKEGDRRLPEPEEDRITAHELAKLLRDDIEHYDTTLRQYLDRLYRILTLIFPLVGIAVTALFRYEEYIVLLLIPFLTSTSILAAGSLAVEMYALAAHKYFLEGSLARMLHNHLSPDLQPEATIPWDDVGGSIAGKALANWALWRLFPVMVASGGAVSIAVAWLNLGHLWYLAAISVPLNLATCGVALWSLAKAPSAYSSTLSRLNVLRDQQTAPDQHIQAMGEGEFRLEATSRTTKRRRADD